MEAPISNIEIAVLTIISITIGFTSKIIYDNIRGNQVRSQLQFANNIIESVASDYSRRLKEFDKAFAELRLAIDILGQKMQKTVHSQNTSPVEQVIDGQDLKTMTSHDTSQQGINTEGTQTNVLTNITPSASISTRNHGSDLADTRSETIYHVLRLLSENDRTSREIQQAIGKSREHTSRLLKRLYEAGLINRETNSKPFKYSISNAVRLGSQDLSASNTPINP
jgi:DNA-binding transcriptional ArsR family regulator